MQHHVYSAFGKLLKVEDGNGADMTDAPVLDPYFTFTGREYDKETGLYYYRARYYDPALGRFLQQDPDPGKLLGPITVTNKYIYAGNNPTNYVDPNGKSFLGKLLVAVALVGIAVATGGGGAILMGALIGAGTSAITEGNILDGALIGGIMGAAGALGGIAGAWASAGAGGWAGALAGAAVGGLVGGIGFAASGVGSFGSGFFAGALVGGFAGYKSTFSSSHSAKNPVAPKPTGGNPWDGLSKELQEECTRPSYCTGNNPRCIDVRGAWCF